MTNKIAIAIAATVIFAITFNVAYGQVEKQGNTTISAYVEQGGDITNQTELCEYMLKQPSLGEGHRLVCETSLRMGLE